MGSSVVGAGFYPGFHAEDLPHENLAQNRLRRALSHELAPVENQELVAEHGSVVEVMHGDDGGRARSPKPAQQLDLVLDIEVIGRLVEQQSHAASAPGRGRVDALAFTARQALPVLIARARVMPTRPRAASTASSSAWLQPPNGGPVRDATEA